ncbi:MAG: VOC family protein [Myxococcales bacterium]|nr:VOC family protein [Myxococcales bacterium]
MSERKVRTCLWFNGRGEEAAQYYVPLIPDSHIESSNLGGSKGPPVVVELTLGGAPFMFLNGGPHYELTPAASIAVTTRDQAETDRLWHALLEGGGKESMCGWLVDRFGVSWQVTPSVLPKMLAAEDRAAADRAMKAMLKMNKIEISILEEAFRGLVKELP